MRFCDIGSFYRLSCVWRETFKSKSKEAYAKDLVEKKYEAEIAESQADRSSLGSLRITLSKGAKAN